MPLPELSDDEPGAALLDATLVEGLARLLAAPLPDIAANLSHFLSRYVDHTALVLLAEDDATRPRKPHGDPSITAALTVVELETIRNQLAGAGGVRLVRDIGGARRTVLASLAASGALLVMTDPARAEFDNIIGTVWEIAALRFREFASLASPAYLMESRAVSSARVEAVADLADQHASTLESLLAVLRSPTLDDHSARNTAVGLATSAAVNLRTETDRVRTASDEPVTKAFERLRSDLRPLLRYREVDVQFVEPPVDGRALPSEVAHGARAVVRGAILAVVDQPNVSRVRVQWDCDGKNLLVDVRDDGTVGLPSNSHQAEPLHQRVAALGGRLTIETTEGWGSEMSVVLPLDPPARQGDHFVEWNLAPREVEVLELVARGLRNKAIAIDMGISENTVKFHVSNILRKLGVSSRSQVVAMINRRRGALAPHPSVT